MERTTDYLKQLSASLSKNYGLNVVDVTPADRGYYGETWQVLAKDERKYFIKIDYLANHQEKFKAGLQLVNYLNREGLDFVGTLKPTNEGELFVKFDAGILAVFDWIDGIHAESDETKPIEYDLLAQVYGKTAEGLPLERMEFSTEMAVAFYRELEKLVARGTGNVAVNQVLTLIVKHRTVIQKRVQRLEHFANICQKDSSHFYITHGDAGGNLLKGASQYYLIDWDEACYAPVERDAWVMCQHAWAREAFNQALAKRQIDYQLREERLAFYGYQMYFFYLKELLADADDQRRLEYVTDYFDGWIEGPLGFVDSL